MTRDSSRFDSREGRSEDLDLASGSWQGRLPHELEEAWDVPRVQLFASVGSTNDVARRLAAEGAPPGTVVVAEEQRTGRGRAGRRWDSRSGLGLWVSMVARPPRTALDTLPLRIGLAVAEALDPWTPERRVDVKWPNDLLIAGSKVGGILCEAWWSGETLEAVVAGIGLNLLHSAKDFPADIRARTTSVRLAFGEGVSRYEVTAAVIRSVHRAIADTADAEWLLRLRDRDMLSGRIIEVTDPDTGALILNGTATGITPDGRLGVTTNTGWKMVRSGSIRLAGSDLR